MENLYNNLVALIGKSLEDDVVKNFLQDIAESPEVETTDFGHSVYWFRNSGFSFYHMVPPGKKSTSRTTGFVYDICIYCRPADWSDAIGEFLPFRGSLPAQINLSDCRSIVHQKLGMMPAETNVEKRAIRPPEFSSEECLAFRIHLKDGTHAEESKRVREWYEAREREPDARIVDVFEIAPYSHLLYFSIDDEQLIGWSVAEQTPEPPSIIRTSTEGN